MTLLRLSLAALVGTALGAGTTAATTDTTRVAPAATAVVVQAPQACAVPSAPAARRVAPDVAPLPAAARRLAAAGASVSVVCDDADATASVVRAAATHDAVLGTGPAVRAALTLAAADHPDRRFGPLPAR